MHLFLLQPGKCLWLWLWQTRWHVLACDMQACKQAILLFVLACAVIHCMHSARSIWKHAISCDAWWKRMLLPDLGIDRTSPPVMRVNSFPPRLHSMMVDHGFASSWIRHGHGDRTHQYTATYPSGTVCTAVFRLIAISKQKRNVSSGAVPWPGMFLGLGTGTAFAFCAACIMAPVLTSRADL